MSEPTRDFDWMPCTDCGDDVHIERWRLGFKFCLLCGEDRARVERASWCVVQEYQKGAYTLVTPESAPITLKQTNQKNIRT
jgi:hypothetical protein